MLRTFLVYVSMGGKAIPLLFTSGKTLLFIVESLDIKALSEILGSEEDCNLRFKLTLQPIESKSRANDKSMRNQGNHYTTLIV